MLRTSSITSALDVTRAAAPWRTSSWHPADTALCTGPGTAMATRPSSSTASRAVMFAPELTAASTTTTPSESPAITRLRRGKWPGRGSTRMANSLTTAPPPFRIDSKSSACSGG